MKNYLLRLLKYLLFVLILFELERAAFMLANATLVAQSSAGEALATFYHAFHLDLSTACYLFAVPFLLMTLQLPFNGKWLDRILDGYTLVILLFIVLSGIGDIFLYPEWGFKINYKIWSYLQNPVEVFRTATWGQVIFGTLGTLIATGGLFLLYRKWFAKPNIQKISKFYWQPVVMTVVGLPLIFVGIRGKITGIPISQSSAYFSQHQILNDAAVNTQWHLVKSTIRFAKSNSTNEFACMDMRQAQDVVNELFTVEKDTTIGVLATDRPNIVLIILESWSADLIESLSGRAGITPNFRELEKEGLLFTQVHATGRRSQEGIASLISGFPSIPVNVITDNFEKYSKLSSLPKSLKSVGYNDASFYFGGDITYGNLKAYLMSMGFGTIVDEKDFPLGTPHGKLSIHDEYVFDYVLDALSRKQGAFFAAVFTGSSHSPYDMPQRVPPLDWDVPDLPYLNSAKYADWALAQFFAKAKNQPWYDNTLFVLVADHSHSTYKVWDYHDAGSVRIPMLWLGGALKEEFWGKQVEKLCCSVDVPATLLSQLGVQTTDFQWSKNVLNPYSQEFATAQNNLGILWITSEGSFSYDNRNGNLYKNTMPDDSTTERNVLKAKAFLQLEYQKYLDY